MTQKKKFLPYGRQTITEEDITAVVDVLRSPYLTQGPAVPGFEKAVCSRVNAGYGIAVNSATSALHIACIALGLGPGKRLWTTPITFVASANCGRYCGAEVNFVDIDPSTGLISVKELKTKLDQAEREGKLPDVVVPVHLCGTSCDMEEINRLAKKYNFYVLEDASHAIGGNYQKRPVGDCRFSDITVFSFHPVKIITTGEGGLATTNNSELAQRMRDLRSHGITKETKRFKEKPNGPWSYEQQELGFNYRMTDLQAALGMSQLGRLDEIIAERKEQFQRYQNLLKDLPLRLLSISEDVDSSIHLGVVRLDNQSRELHRRVFVGLRSKGIGVQLHYTPVHLQPYYRKLGFKEGDYPEAEKYSINAMSLPIYPGLTIDDQTRVVRELCHLLSR